MHFDDRLATVLRLSATGKAVQRIQFRQLLDLLGTALAEERSERLDAAFVRLGELSARIPSRDRAAMIGGGGLRLRSPRLVAALAEGEPEVASAALQRAQLEPDQWLDLIPALRPSTRTFLRQRDDLAFEVKALLTRLGVNDRGLPPGPSEEPLELEIRVDEEADANILMPQPVTGENGIGAIVKRIEAYRKNKQVIEQGPANDAPRLPLGEDHVLNVPEEVQAFDFATDAGGQIIWSDPGVAPMVQGLRLASAARDGDFAALTRRNQPLRGLSMELGGATAIAGKWQLDAAPWFDPLTGNGIGYRGRMRRQGEAIAPLPPVRDSQADRIRQMLHELRTPVNAIQVGAEIIQQQLFGPSPHEYRALAAGIASDAARMMAAFDELDRLAKLESGAMELDTGATDLALVISATVAQLSAHTAHRGSGFAFRNEADGVLVGIAKLDVEQIAWRLLATLAGVSAPHEALKLRLRERDSKARLDLTLPACLAALDGESLFTAAVGAIPQVISAGVFGVGFALRLARAEARAAGGDLVRKDGKLRLTLPGLTLPLADHTDGNRTAG